MSRCKECHKQRQREHRANPKTQYNKQSQERRLEKKQKAINYLGGKCQDCHGKFHPNVYDFHHLDPKEKELTLGLAMDRTWDNLLNELDKCVLLCANCHRLRHV